jgi:hypothetical protein
VYQEPATRRDLAAAPFGSLACAFSLGSLSLYCLRALASEWTQVLSYPTSPAPTMESELTRTSKLFSTIVLPNQLPGPPGTGTHPGFVVLCNKITNSDKNLLFSCQFPLIECTSFWWRRFDLAHLAHRQIRIDWTVADNRRAEVEGRSQKSRYSFDTRG